MIAIMPEVGQDVHWVAATVWPQYMLRSRFNSCLVYGSMRCGCA